jgi:hypothetical protein
MIGPEPPLLQGETPPAKQEAWGEPLEERDANSPLGNLESQAPNTKQFPMFKIQITNHSLQH